MTRRVPQREFFAMGEVCEMFGLKPHVLRYWETQFEALSPPKNRSGNRVYRARDLELIALIQRLVRDERYTVSGAKLRIEELWREGEHRTVATAALGNAFVRSLRTELQQLLEILGPEPG